MKRIIIAFVLLFLVFSCQQKKRHYSDYIIEGFYKNDTLQAKGDQVLFVVPSKKYSENINSLAKKSFSKDSLFNLLALKIYDNLNGKIDIKFKRVSDYKYTKHNGYVFPINSKVIDKNYYSLILSSKRKKNLFLTSSLSFKEFNEWYNGYFNDNRLDSIKRIMKSDYIIEVDYSGYFGVNGYVFSVSNSKRKMKGSLKSEEFDSINYKRFLKDGVLLNNEGFEYRYIDSINNNVEVFFEKAIYEDIGKYSSTSDVYYKIKSDLGSITIHNNPPKLDIFKVFRREYLISVD